jgi:formylglycine-generating enzyme required for sulfatase activity
MVIVRAGPFLRGSLPGKGEPDESPRRQIQVSKFYIDKYSVTVAQYMRCVEAGVCSLPDLEKGCNWPSAKTKDDDEQEEPEQEAAPPEEEGQGGEEEKSEGPSPEEQRKAAEAQRKAAEAQRKAAEARRLEELSDHPINCVNWFQAQEYCKWAGKRLPTEAEWEKAARWVDGRVYPWGNQRPSCRRANYFKRKKKKYCHGQTVPVTRYRRARSPYGAVQMSGNVYEWVQDWYEKDYYREAPVQDPMGAYEGKYRVIRGGSWFSPPIDLRAAMRGPLPPVMQLAYVGFRCASDPKKFWKSKKKSKSKKKKQKKKKKKQKIEKKIEQKHRKGTKNKTDNEKHPASQPAGEQAGKKPGAAAKKKMSGAAAR